MKFKDYPQHLIDVKLQQCLDYEAKYGTIPQVTATKKLCQIYEYRKN